MSFTYIHLNASWQLLHKLNINLTHYSVKDKLTRTDAAYKDGHIYNETLSNAIYIILLVMMTSFSGHIFLSLKSIETFRALPYKSINMILRHTLIPRNTYVPSHILVNVTPWST